MNAAQAKKTIVLLHNVQDLSEPRYKLQEYLKATDSMLSTSNLKKVEETNLNDARPFLTKCAKGINKDHNMIQRRRIISYFERGIFLA